MLNTVLFDMGGTLEDIYFTDETVSRAAHETQAILRRNGVEPGCDAVELMRRLRDGIAQYKKYSEGEAREKKPGEIWTEYYLKSFDFDRAALAACAEELAGMWEVTYFHRELRPEVPAMLEALRERGYRLGVISNSCSEDSVFDMLEKYEIRDYFEDVTVSAVVGYRKPHPAIFHIALRQMRVAAQNCVYIGDTRSRDVIGAKNAGFGRAVLIQSKLTARNDSLMKSDTFEPDHIIMGFDEFVPYLDAQNTN